MMSGAGKQSRASLRVLGLRAAGWAQSPRSLAQLCDAHRSDRHSVPPLPPKYFGSFWPPIPRPVADPRDGSSVS